MKRPITAALVATVALATIAATPASAAAPRPGCGYGDTNHSHQAAPGRDPLGLRPGLGIGDEVHQHTTAPGLAPEGAGDQDNPQRGCK